MNQFDSFEQSLQDCLNHLYDPAYDFPAEMQETLGVEASGLQAALAQAIQAMKPGPEVPPAGRGWRVYEVLAARYLQRMTQDEAAEHLAISPRHLRREQAQSIHALAQTLWQRRLDAAAAPVNSTVTPWAEQVQSELAALKKGASESIASVDDVLTSTIGLVTQLAERYDVALRREPGEMGLFVNARPAELRQILVLSLSALVRQIRSAELVIRVERQDDIVQIHLLGEVEPGFAWPENLLLQELLRQCEGKLLFPNPTKIENQKPAITLQLPSSPKIPILVVDDNTDLVHFYQRYVRGTPFQVTAIHSGKGIFTAIAETAPRLIVLDVMLPDVDGWELLAHLHAHPDTAHIPVVVCTVVREEELALMLGAARYLPKPVGRQEFIEVLQLAIGA
jgi:CheY-like chemotaxis protein